MQLFKPEEYYAWFYEGSQWTTYVGGLAMVAIMLAGVMFPLWPPIMRMGVWYISVGVLGLIGLLFAIAIVRLIFYIITVVVASPGIWIFPRLFADVGFVRTLPTLSVSVVSPRITICCNKPCDSYRPSMFISIGRLLYPALGVGPSQEEIQETLRRQRQEVKGLQTFYQSGSIRIRSALTFSFPNSTANERRCVR